MNRTVLCVCALAFAPIGASAATVVVDGGSYDVTSDNLFTGIVISTADGPGNYIVEFFNPPPFATVVAVADSSTTAATINQSFTDLTMSWIDGLSMNTLVSTPGVDTLTTVFNSMFPVQQLVFEWSDSVDLAGFRFDVQPEFETAVAVPVPASILFLGSALASLGYLGRRRRKMVSPA